MFNNETILAIITARGGSKGIIRKNIRKIAGKPLIAWTIEAGKKSKYIDRMILSSEDGEIIKIAQNYGCEVPFVRPTELALDNTSSVDVVLHAVNTIKNKYDVILLLQPTSPLRNEVDIDDCIEFFFKKNGVTCTSIRETQEPPFRMYYLNDKKIVPILKRQHYNRRQDMPITYITNGAIYLVRTDYFCIKKRFVDEDTLGYIMPLDKSFDVDTEDDLKKCEEILSNHNMDYR